MRRSGLASAALLLVLVAAPAAARQTPARAQTQRYLYSHGVDTWHWTVSARGVLPPLVFTPRPGDAVVHLAVDDASDQPVFVHVRQEGDRGEEDLFVHFCGRAEIVHLVSAEPVEVFVFTGACQNHTTGFATTGTITATFARRL
jgi:hypothetical protein